MSKTGPKIEQVEIEKHLGSVKVHLDPEVLHVFQLKPTKEI